MTLARLRQTTKTNGNAERAAGRQEGGSLETCWPQIFAAWPARQNFPIGVGPPPPRALVGGGLARWSTSAPSAPAISRLDVLCLRRQTPASRCASRYRRHPVSEPEKWPPAPRAVYYLFFSSLLGRADERERERRGEGPTLRCSKIIAKPLRSRPSPSYLGPHHVQ